MSPWQTYTVVEKEEYSKIGAFIFGKIGWFAASFCKTCRKRFIVRTFCGKNFVELTFALENIGKERTQI